MKIAVTYDGNGQVFQHFGHTQFFKVYETEGSEVKNSVVLTTGGSGHCALGGFLQAMGVQVLICGGIGMGAQNALSNAGIRFFGGVQGDADQAVQALLNGALAYDPDARCDHHDHHHGEGHTCGSHEHTCGGHCHN